MVTARLLCDIIPNTTTQQNQMSAAEVPPQMNAIGFTEFGGIEVLKELSVDVPSVAGYDVLVKNVAAATNPVDALVRVNFGQPGACEGQKIAGYDASGVVVAVGEKVHSFAVGDEVYFAGSLVRHGTHAQYTAVDSRIIAHKPKSLSHLDAATVPLVALTAWEGLFEGLHLTSPASIGKSILVLPGAGGVGSIVIQLAAKVLNMTVIATASADDSSALCKKLGAHHVINHRGDIKAQLVEAGFPTVDYIYNGYSLEANYETYCDIIAPCGGIVNIVGLAGPIDLRPLMMKRVSFVWEAMFARSMFNLEPEKQNYILSTVAHLIDSGVLQTVRSETLKFTLEDYKRAQELQASGKTRGKIAIDIAE